jgi:hypothetical protein
MVTTAMMLALTLVFQLGFSMFSQPMVGPLVNMCLFIAVMVAGIPSAIIIGCISPLAAYLLGIMPVLPVLPFIMLGNAVLVLVFGLFSKIIKNKYSSVFSVVLAAISKFALLAFSIRLFVPLLMPKVPVKLVESLTIPQLVTALIGGFLALIIHKYLISLLLLQRRLK